MVRNPPARAKKPAVLAADGVDDDDRPVRERRMAARRMQRKRALPVARTREHLEPGPIVLISSAYKGERNIMTLGWHMMLEYNVVGCYGVHRRSAADR